MAKKVFIDIKVLGDKKLQKKLNRLTEKVQTVAMRKALRDTAKMAKKRVDSNLAAVSPGEFGSGRLASLGSKVRARPPGTRTPKGLLRAFVVLPSRDQLNIEGDDPYYPAFLEYGNPPTLDGRRMLRNALDSRKGALLRLLRNKLRKWIEVEARRERKR